MASRSNILVTPQIQESQAKISSPLLQNFGYVWKVNGELSELSCTPERIKDPLCFSEEAQATDALLKLYLRDLKDVVSCVIATLDEFIGEAKQRNLEQNRGRKQVREHFFFSLENKISHRKEIGPTINEIKDKLVKIENKLERYYLMGSGLRRDQELERKVQSVSFMSTNSGFSIDDSGESDLLLGRKEDANIILKMLTSNEFDRREVPVITIVGDKGIGKTTLAQLVYNDLSVEKHFEIRVWVSVSNAFDVISLTTAILESVTLNHSKLKFIEPFQCELQRILRGKRFILVSDDVCNRNLFSWNALRAPFLFADRESRIIVSTRSETVASMMNPIHTLNLQVLSEEYCWLLFKKRLCTKEHDIHPGLEAIGRQIVQKCKGLPEAVDAVANHLQNKVDKHEWEMILEDDWWVPEENK
ncbi:putative disease resistance protein RGA4 [Macadamia integrifolia]|uniref:putative disease resistance protein RGA4 n=1 Tax=Macadamia integrifolia TaxID=60698 RepID=UPI001C50230F|nr:putative disease resistance protein RGA4 [Macadamia integrifolia]